MAPTDHGARYPARSYNYNLPAFLSTDLETRDRRASDASTPTLVLIRGLPGSGKTTMAKTIAGCHHFEADQFFEVNGEYRYDPSRIREAHEWCQSKTSGALGAGYSVVVSNTFTRLSEIEAYLGLTDNVRIVEAVGRWKNVHGVPAETVERMRQRWEPLYDILGTLAKRGWASGVSDVALRKVRRPQVSDPARLASSARG